MFTGVPSLVKTYALEEATAENNASGDAVCPGHSASRAEIGHGSASATLLCAQHGWVVGVIQLHLIWVIVCIYRYIYIQKYIYIYSLSFIGARI